VRHFLVAVEMSQLRKCNVSLGYEAVSFGKQVPSALSEERIGFVQNVVSCIPEQVASYRSPSSTNGLYLTRFSK
jgi:hypothetical protein